MEEQKERDLHKDLENTKVEQEKEPGKQETYSPNASGKDSNFTEITGSQNPTEKRKNYKRFYRKNSNYRHKNYQKNTQSSNLNINNKIISVVIPVYNEEESVVELSISLKKVFEQMRANYEVIFVDDGSTDSSFQKIKEINHLNNRFRCIKFKRNYGKSAALSEGFKACKGDYVITMDSDLQDEPEEIPVLIAKLNEGYDLVSGWKKVRHDPFIKRQSSKLFNFTTSKLVGLKLHDYNCGLKGYKKELVKTMKIYGEMHRYIPALAYLSGFKVCEIPVIHHPRKFGRTKFGSSRFIKGLLDLLTVLFTTKFIKRPLHFFGILGIINSLIGVGIIIYLTILKFFDSVPISNRPLFLVGILLSIVGVQFVSLGLIGEMITKTSLENDNILIEKTLP